MANTDAALALAAKILRMQAELDSAKKEFEALLHGAADKHAVARKVRQRVIGKQPDPNSANQRVLATITGADPNPMTIDGLVHVLKLTNKQVRQAVSYHTKKGRIANVGPSTYALKQRSLDSNGAQMNLKG